VQFMQTGSQEYRRKAAQCAQKALACREPAIRRGFAEAARRWRNLAQKKEAGAVSGTIRLAIVRPDALA
jgi:hypothetical protein